MKKIGFVLGWMLAAFLLVMSVRYFGLTIGNAVNGSATVQYQVAEQQLAGATELVMEVVKVPYLEYGNFIDQNVDSALMRTLMTMIVPLFTSKGWDHATMLAVTANLVMTVFMLLLFVFYYVIVVKRLKRKLVKLITRGDGSDNPDSWDYPVTYINPYSEPVLVHLANVTFFMVVMTVTEQRGWIFGLIGMTLLIEAVRWARHRICPPGQEARVALQHGASKVAQAIRDKNVRDSSGRKVVKASLIVRFRRKFGL